MDKLNNSSIPEKKLSNVSDVRDKSQRVFNHKLQIALEMNGFKEISTFAQKIGFSRSFISKVMHGLIKPTLSQAQIISNALNVKIQTIFEPSDIRNFLTGRKNDSKN